MIGVAACHRMGDARCASLALSHLSLSLSLRLGTSKLSAVVV